MTMKAFKALQRLSHPKPKNKQNTPQGLEAFQYEGLSGHPKPKGHPFPHPTSITAFAKTMAYSLDLSTGQGAP